MANLELRIQPQKNGTKSYKTKEVTLLYRAAFHVILNYDKQSTIYALNGYLQNKYLQ